MIQILISTLLNFIMQYIYTSGSVFKCVAGPKCEVLTIPMCRNVGYTSASFPNYFKHRTQSEASLEIHQFFPLVKAGCSANLTDFLCKVYAPPCNAGKTPLVPCRELCESARGGCEGVMKKFGFAWPDHLRCDRFPLQSTNQCLAGK